jgi:hypothetical protein
MQDVHAEPRGTFTIFSISESTILFAGLVSGCAKLIPEMSSSEVPWKMQAQLCPNGNGCQRQEGFKFIHLQFLAMLYGLHCPSRTVVSVRFKVCSTFKLHDRLCVYTAAGHSCSQMLIDCPQPSQILPDLCSSVSFPLHGWLTLITFAVYFALASLELAFRGFNRQSSTGSMKV